MKRAFSIVFGGVLAAALASGCEVIVGADPPSYDCSPGDPNACATGKLCYEGVCVARCPDTPCADGTVCNMDAHVCVPPGQLPEGGTEDGTLPDAPADDHTAPPDVVEKDNTASETDSPVTLGDVGAQCQTQ